MNIEIIDSFNPKFRFAMASKLSIYLKLGLICLLLMGTVVPVCAMDDSNLDVLFPYFNDELNWEDQYFYSAIIEMDDEFFSALPNKQVFEIKASYGKHNFSLAYHGDGLKKVKPAQELDHIVQINDTQDPSSDKKSYMDIIYQYNLVNLDNQFGDISVGLIGKMKSMDHFLIVDDMDDENVEEKYDQVFMPGLNLGFGFLDKNLNFNLIGTGMENDDQSLFQGLAIFSFKPTSYLNIEGGYKIMYIDLDDQRQKTASDTYLSITLNF